MRYELLNSVLFLTIAVNIAGCTLSPQFLGLPTPQLLPCLGELRKAVNGTGEVSQAEGYGLGISCK